MIRRYALWTAAVLAIFVGTAAQAAEDVYHAIPSDSLAFVAVNRIAETSAKVQKLGQLVGAPPVGLLDLAKTSAGVKKGLDETRSAALVVMPGKSRRNEETAPVFLIPVSDYKQFLESWNAKPTGKIVEVKIGGGDELVGQRGDYAAIVPKEYRPALEKLLNAKRSIADDHPEIVPWLLENDAVAVATTHGIKMASDEMQKELKQAQEMFLHMGEDAGPEMPMMATATMQVYVDFLKWAAKDVQIVAAGARADKENTVRIATRTRLAKDSAVAATLAKLQPSDKSPLLGMPGGTFFAAGGGVWSNSLTQGIVSSQTGLMKQFFRVVYDLDEKKAEELAKTLLDMPQGLRSLSVMIGPGQPGEPILSDVLALYGVDDAKKYLDEYEKFIRAYDAAGKDDKAASEKKVFAVKKTEVGGRPALETEISLSISAKIKDAAGSEEAMQKLFGPGGKFKNLVVAIDDHTLAIAFGDSSPLVMRAIAALKQPADGLAADADVVKTVAMLPAGAQWVGCISPSGAVAFVKWVIDTTMAENAFFKPNIPDFPASPPIGIAVKAVPGELQTEIVVSSAVLEAIGKYVGIVQSAEHPEVP